MTANILADSAQVFTHYGDVPSHPGAGWTRFVCVSDTHSRAFSVPPGEVLLHSGDLSSWGYPEQLDATLNWLKGLNHGLKIIIAGNHDLWLDPSVVEEEVEEILRSRTTHDVQVLARNHFLPEGNIRYLEHEAVTFRTASGKEWSVYGSPATPKYAKGAFQYSSEEEAKEWGTAIYAQVPLNIDILLTHTPAQGILDVTRRGKHAGCEYLAERLAELTRCRLHVFGHIHEGWGASMNENGLIAVNAALWCHGSQPIIVDLKD